MRKVKARLRETHTLPALNPRTMFEIICLSKNAKATEDSRLNVCSHLHESKIWFGLLSE